MESIKSQLQNMGFDEVKVDIALKSCPEAQTLEQVMEWLIAHEDELNKETQASGEKAKQTEDNPDVSTQQDPSSQAAQEAVGDDKEAKKKLTVQEAQRIIAERLAKRAEEERKKEIENEKKRRVDGQKMSEVRAELSDQEMINMAAAIRREKLEKEFQRKQVLEQIARDRENMRQRSNPKPLSEKLNPSSSSAPKPQERQSNECKIALRFPDGTNLIHKFSPNEQLSAVRLYVQTQKNTDSSMEFVAPPNKKLTEAHMHETLDKLGLCPASRLEVKLSHAMSDLD